MKYRISVTVDEETMREIKTHPGGFTNSPGERIGSVLISGVGSFESDDYGGGYWQCEVEEIPDPILPGDVVRQKLPGIADALGSTKYIVHYVYRDEWALVTDYADAFRDESMPTLMRSGYLVRDPESYLQGPKD